MIPLKFFVIGLLHISTLLHADNSTNTTSTTNGLSTSTVGTVATSSDTSASSTTVDNSTPSATTPNFTTGTTTPGSTKGIVGPASQTLCAKIKAKNDYSQFWDHKKIANKKHNFQKVFIVAIITMVVGSMLTLIAIVITCKDTYSQDEKDEAASDAKIDERTAIEERASAVAFEEDDE